MSAAKYGYLFQGQHYNWQRRPRGTPGLDLDPALLRQLSSEPRSGRELRARPARASADKPSGWRAMTAVLLLLPGTPMLFQGQEFSASAPFLFFADFDEELAAAVRKGRAEFLMQFPSVVDYVARRGARRSRPASRPSNGASSISSEREPHADAYAFHRDLLALRRNSAGAASSAAADGGRCGPRRPHAFALRFFATDSRDDRVLVVNLGGRSGPQVRRRSAAGAAGRLPTGRSQWSSERSEVRWRRNARHLGHRPWSVPGEMRARARAAARRTAAATTTVRRTRRERIGPLCPCAGFRGRLPARFRIPSRWSPRVAGDERPGRLRVGHRGRRHHAPVSRHAHRRAAGAARAHGHVEPRGREVRWPTAAATRSAAASGAATRPTRTGRATSSSSGWKRACRSGATTSTA